MTIMISHYRPILITYCQTISPGPYPNHTTVNISPSWPSLSSTATQYHHEHIAPTWTSKYHHHPHPYHIQQHHITRTISHSQDHRYITIIPTPMIHNNIMWLSPYPAHSTINISPSFSSLSYTATPYHYDHIPPTQPSIYHHHPHPYHLQQHNITMNISQPHAHHDITIIPISIIYIITISPGPYPAHRTIDISPSSPFPTPIIHNNIISLWPYPNHIDHQWYHHPPHPYHLQQHHITTTISHPHDHQYITIIPILIIYSNTISPLPYPAHTTVNISPSSPSL